MAGPTIFGRREFRDAEGRADAIAAARARNADRPDPMDWIADAPAKVRNSPFWSCTRQVVDALEPDSSSPWYSRFCWMNLYPCAPGRGNPEGALREAEAPFVGNLLRAQVERLDAKRIICFVGSYWWSAAEVLVSRTCQRRRHLCIGQVVTPRAASGSSACTPTARAIADAVLAIMPR